MLPLKRTAAAPIDDAPLPKRVFPGSSSAAAGVGSEPIDGSVFDSTYAELQSLLSRAVELSNQLPTTTFRLICTAGVLPPEHAFNADA